jgi:hypothetical protein
MKHLIAIILVVSIATIVVEGRHNRHSGGWGRHEHECKTSCFAHCLAGTTADVNDFCNLTGFSFTYFFSQVTLFSYSPYFFELYMLLVLANDFFSHVDVLIINYIV